MAYWVQADDAEEFQMMRRVPTHLPGMLTRDEFVAALLRADGLRSVTPEQWRFYEVFGLFRLAVIAQQIYYRYFHGQTTNEMYALFGPAVQILGRRHRRAASTTGVSRILLVRHGQASFGAADYDDLSAAGHEQSRVLGAALAARGVAPDVAGRRRDATARARPRPGSSTAPAGRPTSTVDAGWNEFDHLQVLAVHDQPDDGGRASRRRPPSSAWFEEATQRWTSGEHDEEYDESFAAFTARVEAALGAARGDAAPQAAPPSCSPAAGPIAWAAASLLADDRRARPTCGCGSTR